MRHHFAAYGFWAPAISEYVDHRIMQRRDTENYLKLLKLEDPFAYRDRLQDAEVRDQRDSVRSVLLARFIAVLSSMNCPVKNICATFPTQIIL